MDKFRFNLEIPIKTFMSDVYYDLNSEVTFSQVYIAKTKAMKIIQGSHIDQNNKLWYMFKCCVEGGAKWKVITSISEDIYMPTCMQLGI